MLSWPLSGGAGARFVSFSVLVLFEISCHLGYTAVLSCSVLLLELPDPNLGMGASGTQASGGAIVPKGTNKRRAA